MLGFDPTTVKTNIDFQIFINAIACIESGYNPSSVGDDGKALGIFQIWESYYKDAKGFSIQKRDKYNLKDTQYKDVLSHAVAYRVVLAYFERYEPKALINNDFETLARLHNSGPNWRNKKYLTNNYWKKVKSFFPTVKDKLFSFTTKGYEKARILIINF